jgi:polysaccharide export outer membrane protein
MKTLLTKTTIGVYLLLGMLVMSHPNKVAAQQVAQPTTGSANEMPVAAQNENGSMPGNTNVQSRLRIGPGDLLNVTVFDVPELAQTVRVSDQGDATFQLIGSLHLAGLTTDDARTLIAQELKDGNLILHPQVSVLISEYSTQGVSVVGEVQKPGVYPVLGSRTLLDIISEAGGTTPAAGPDVTVKHPGGDTVSFRLTKNAQASLATDIELLPGDKVIVPRAGLIYVLGEVGRPGGFLMENDGKMSILQAVAMAGGTNRTAYMNHTRLIRKTATGYEEIPIPLKTLLQSNGGDMQLQAEDILYVPTNVAKAALYRTTPSLVNAASSAAIYRGIP